MWNVEERKVMVEAWGEINGLDWNFRVGCEIHSIEKTFVFDLHYLGQTFESMVSSVIATHSLPYRIWYGFVSHSVEEAPNDPALRLYLRRVGDILFGWFVGEGGEKEAVRHERVGEVWILGGEFMMFVIGNWNWCLELLFRIERRQLWAWIWFWSVYVLEFNWLDMSRLLPRWIFVKIVSNGLISAKWSSMCAGYTLEFLWVHMFGLCLGHVVRSCWIRCSVKLNWRHFTILSIVWSGWGHDHRRLRTSTKRLWLDHWLRSDYHLLNTSAYANLPSS